MIGISKGFSSAPTGPPSLQQQNGKLLFTTILLRILIIYIHTHFHIQTNLAFRKLSIHLAIHSSIRPSDQVLHPCNLSRNTIQLFCNFLCANVFLLVCVNLTFPLLFPFMCLCLGVSIAALSFCVFLSHRRQCLLFRPPPHSPANGGADRPTEPL